MKRFLLVFVLSLIINPVMAKNVKVEALSSYKSDEILPALRRKPQYLAEPDNWECFDQEEIK
jgi:hypothetical protein